jgi:hypothetical protein
MNSLKCEICKVFFCYHDNLCSNCFTFKKTGIYNIQPINTILRDLCNKYINKNLINFLIKMILSNLNLKFKDLYEFIENNDIYIKYEHAQTIYNLLRSNNKNKNMNLQHILSFRIIDYWNNKLGGASCYYDNGRDKPASTEDGIIIIVNNVKYIKYFLAPCLSAV